MASIALPHPRQAATTAAAQLVARIAFAAIVVVAVATIAFGSLGRVAGSTPGAGLHGGPPSSEEVLAHQLSGR